MSNSLRDQLLKAGLVTEEQAKQADKPKKQNRPGKGKKRPASKRQARPTQPAAPKVLSAEEKEAIKAHKQKIREFLREAKLNKPDAEVAYYFQANKRTAHMYVTPEQQKQLAAGALAILLRNERHYLLSLENAEKMRELDKDSVIFIASEEKPMENQQDDPYAAYQVPDDLQW